MALTSSGQLSMGDINVELGRTRTTSNTSLAGGTTPIGTSLFGLASSSVNKTAPHSISEFYGYSNGSVTITGTYYHSFTTTSQGGGGTITVTGSSARFFARAVCLDNAAGVAVSVSASSFNSYITRSNSTGTSDGTIFTLQPGTYSYSYSVVKQFGYAIGGGLVFIQP